MNLFENLQLMKESKQQNDEKVKKDIESKKKNDEFLRNRFKTESLTNDKLWDKFNELFKGFIPLEDLTNYCSLDQFGEFVQWLRHEADMDYDYNKIYRNWDEVFKDLYDATGLENTDSISMENIFNFFSTADLEDFWEWIEKEYGLDEEEEDSLEESKHLKEYKSNINNKTELWDEMLRYTVEPLVSFNDLFNCYSTDDLQDLYDYLSSEYEDDEFPVYRGKINNKDEMWDAMNELILPNEQQIGFNDLFNCYSLDKLKELYDYLSSEYSDIDDLEESVKLEKLSIGNKLQAVFDKFDSNIKLVGFMLQFIDEDTIEKMYNEIASVEEATSGISGAYTTKAIDMIPTGVKKSKEIKENVKSNYISKIDSETSNVELVNILHKVRANKGLSLEDRKELEDKIRNKVRNIKTEAITEFYGKEWTDNEIKKAIDIAKENPDAVGYIDPNECASPFTYNGKTYYTVGEGKEIVFDGKDCVVYLTVDEELNRYLSYYEMKWIPYSDGDVENGMSAPDYEINEVPYKVVEV